MVQMEPKKVRLKIVTLASCGLAAGLLGLAAGARESALAQKNTPSLTPVTSRTNASIAPLPGRTRMSPPMGVFPSAATGTDSYLDRTPPRQIHGLRLVKAPMNWAYDCTECHKLLPAKWHYDRPLSEHQHIQLEHGENRFCLNCHHAANRSAFADYDGAEIAEGDVVLLCAKCHGPTYRDWQAGAHGRRNGYWDLRQGTQTRLRCIECHDPHRPKFQAMKPLAPLLYPARAAHPPGHAQ
jgi:hypothetical protein